MKTDEGNEEEGMKWNNPLNLIFLVCVCVRTHICKCVLRACMYMHMYTRAHRTHVLLGKKNQAILQKLAEKYK